MKKYLFCFIGALFLSFFSILCWHKLLNKNLEIKNYRFYCVLFLVSIIITCFGFLFPRFLRIFFSTILLCVVNYLFFCRDWPKMIFTVLFSEIILFLGEFIFVLLCSNFFVDGIETIIELPFGNLIINIGVTLIALIFLKFKFVYWLFDYLIKTFNNMRRSNLIIYFALTVVLMSLFIVLSYIDLSKPLLLICNVALTLFYIVILFKLANARENFRAVNNKYETSLKSLREYEDMMDKYKIANHENKNQLLTIRNMIKSKDKNVIKYIDELIDNKIKDNEAIFYRTSKIPEGGLRATIYSKLCKMEDMKINYELDISNDVRTVDLIELGDYTTLNICNIIGVFLDNAIEEVDKIDEKYIIIEIFVMDNKLNIDISNNYVNNINLDKIQNSGYTTKGGNHGYGLSLVTELITADSNLEHESKISRDMFTQRLKIKM